MPEVFGFDCFSPDQIAERVERVGVAKAALPWLSMVVLGVLAGGFIGLGAMAYTIVAADASLSFAAARWGGGAVFSLGLLLVVVAGAELFTGNNLLVMAVVSRRITVRRLLQVLTVVYVANFVGAAGLAWLVAQSGHASLNGGAVGRAALAIAAAKCALPWGEALCRGVLCNVLVCLAVWLALAGRTVVDKAVAVVLPVATFVAAGFEHCVANMYFLPLAGFVENGKASVGAAGAAPGVAEMLAQLLPVTIGNVLGGGLVGLVYWTVYRRSAQG